MICAIHPTPAPTITAARSRARTDTEPLRDCSRRAGRRDRDRVRPAQRVALGPDQRHADQAVWPITLMTEGTAMPIVASAILAGMPGTLRHDRQRHAAQRDAPAAKHAARHPARRATRQA
jgi:hypothetical protein